MTGRHAVPEASSSQPGWPAPRWLAQAVLAPKVAALASAVSAPCLVSAQLQLSNVVHDYVVGWATRPDPGSRYAARTRLLSWLPRSILPRALMALGYDGLVYFRGSSVIGHVFYQHRRAAFHAFSTAVHDSIAGKGYAAVMLMDFLAYASSRPGVARARLGSGRNAVTRRLLERLQPHQGKFGWHVAADGWVTFRSG